MKVSLNTVRQFIDFELPPVDDMVQRINTQLGGVEEVVTLEDRYKDVVIVRIVACSKHPSADRLQVCLIDDGGAVNGVERTEDGFVQVVCGAPNARVGLVTAWLPPKSVVPATYDDPQPVVLDVRELRGVRSSGMLAAIDELAIGAGHDGIIDIGESDLPQSISRRLRIGEKFAPLFGLDDTIITIENKMFTHRPDCFGQLGVAREIAGILGHAFHSPSWYAQGQKTPSAIVPRSKKQGGEQLALPLTVTHDAGDSVPRFMAMAVKGVTVQPSPLWLQVELMRLGGKPINNIVDITNYVMLLTAQPTHAYDYDTLHGGTLGTRMARAGETCSLLNGKTYTLSEDDIVIADTAGVVGLGGVMGGSGSEVSLATTNVVLEVATFDMYTIRKTSMRHGLFTDAVTRFTKGQSPHQTDVVLNLLLRLVLELSGGTQASDVYDTGSHKTTRPAGAVGVTAEFINARLGLTMSQYYIGELLKRVEFDVHMADGSDDLVCRAPFWRTDIERPEDIVEEIGRLHGFDGLPRELPYRRIVPAAKNPTFETKKYIRSRLSRLGANEVLSYSFVHEDLFTKAGQDKREAYQLSNALSPGLQYYRLSVTPSLLDKVHPNIKAGHGEFALFEIGKAHGVHAVDNDGLPREYEQLAFVWAAQKTQVTGYFMAKRYLEYVASGAKFVPLATYDLSHHRLVEQLSRPFDPQRSAVVVQNGTCVGVVGEYMTSVRTAFKLPQGAAGFEVFVSCVSQAAERPYTPLSRFPHSTQDISLRVATSVSYTALYDLVVHTANAHRPEGVAITVQPLSIYQPEHKTDEQTITFRLSAVSYEKTLNDDDVTSILSAIETVAHTQLRAQRS